MGKHSTKRRLAQISQAKKRNNHVYHAFVGMKRGLLEATCSKRHQVTNRLNTALVFAGEALTEAYTLETASLLLREAWAGLEVVDDDGVLYNRIARLSPLRGPGRGDTVAASQEREGLVSSSPNPLTACPLGIPAESHGIFDGYCT